MDLPNLVAPGTRAALLVEGQSDRAAVEAAAASLGLDLPNDGTQVMAMGGATNIGHYLSRLAERPDLLIGGLYDAGEENYVRRSLERFRIAPENSVQSLAAVGFFVCVQDLEDEFLRALGTDAVLDVVESEGELGSFRILQNQPAHRGERLHDQLHRFIGTRARRKIRYGRLLAEAAAVDQIPQPLVRLIEYASG